MLMSLGAAPSFAFAVFITRWRWGAAQVESFLAWLVTDRQVAPATHKQTLSAMTFLYAKVMEVQRPWLAQIGRAAFNGGCRLSSQKSK
jgi:hypothetical protein